MYTCVYIYLGVCVCMCMHMCKYRVDVDKESTVHGDCEFLADHHTKWCEIIYIAVNGLTIFFRLDFPFFFKFWDISAPDFWKLSFIGISHTFII